MKPTQEQTKEFWEWCGFYSKVVTNKSADFNGIYMDNDGMFKQMPDTHERTLWHDPEITPDSGCRDYWYAENGLPPIDLNNLFKYAVPKVKNMKMHLGYRGYEVKILKVYGENEYDTYLGDDKDPALALFWAIWKVHETL